MLDSKAEPWHAAFPLFFSTKWQLRDHRQAADLHRSLGVRQWQSYNILYAVEDFVRVSYENSREGNTNERIKNATVY